MVLAKVRIRENGYVCDELMCNVHGIGLGVV